MLTTPTAFSDFQNRTGATNQVIVKLTDGTNTWLLSNGSDMDLSDGHVYPLIESFSGINQSLDIFSKVWAVNVAQLILSNVHYKQNSSGVWTRLSDELSGILYKDATIYLLCGENVSGLSDCLTVFSAKVLDTLYYDDNTIRITLHDKSVINNTIIPANKIEDTYSAAPPKSLPLKIPLVYGEFTTDYDAYDKSGLGLAVIHSVNKLGTDFVVSDHILDAISNIYIHSSEIDDVIQYIIPIVTVDSSGRGRVTDTDGLVHAWVYPVDNDDSKYSMEGVVYADLANVIDRDSSTYTEALVNQALGDGSEVTPKAIYMMSLDDRLLRNYKEHPQFAYKFSTPGFAFNGAYSYLTSKRRLYYYSDDKWGDLFTGEGASSFDTASWIPFFFPLSTIIRGPDHVTVGTAAFIGTGLNDLTSGGSYVAPDSVEMTYYIKIGTTGTPDTFQFHKGSAGTWGSEIAMTGSAQALMDGVSITWGSTTGHNTSQFWSIRVYVSGTIDAPVMYAGTGPDDVSKSGTFVGLPFGINKNLEVAIDGVGSPNTFKWRFGVGSYTTGVSITGGVQTLSNGVTIKFEETDNHLLNDKWDTTVYAAASGVNDVLSSGLFTGDRDTLYKLIIDGLLGLNYGGELVDTYDIFRDGVQIFDHKACTTGSLIVDKGVSVSWQRNQQHVLNSYFEINCLAPRIPNANFMLGIYVEGTIASGPRQATDWFFRISEARLKIRFLADGTVPHFAECKGREYSSWISSRSSNYSSGAVIEDPAGIIESILRDVVGLVTADIDETSFINSENTSVKSRINLFTDNSMKVDEVIRQIAEQSTFAYVWSAAGKARCIPLNNTSPTTNRTIPYSHIIDGRITISQTSEIVNDIQINSRWQQEYGSFANRDNFTNGTSQTTYGVRKYEANWYNVAGSSVTTLKDHYVDGADAIWIDAHNVIEIETVGFTNADLEIGDWIELDSGTCDRQIKPFGASWSGKQFLVVELQQFADRTKIKAIQLY